jgi:hypothetical protein
MVLSISLYRVPDPLLSLKSFFYPRQVLAEELVPLLTNLSFPFAVRSLLEMLVC